MPLYDLESLLLLFETFITPIVRETARIYQHSASRGPSAVAELFVTHVHMSFGNFQAHSSPQTASWSVSAVFIGPRCHAVQCIVIGKKTPKTAPSPSDFVTLPEEDRATAIGNMHKNW